MGLVEGWLYGPHIKQLNKGKLELVGGYKVGFSFILVADIMKSKNPDKCKEGQYAKSTARITKYGSLIVQSKYAGLDYTKDDAGAPSISKISKDFMHSRDEIIEKKSIREFKTMTINEFGSKMLDLTPEMVQIIRDNPIGFKDFELCWHEGNIYCYDGYLEPDIAKGRPYGLIWKSSEYDSKKHLSFTKAKHILTNRMGGYITVPGRNARIVWWDSPGPYLSLEYFSYENIRGDTSFYNNYPGNVEMKFSAISIVEDEAPRAVNVDKGDGVTEVQIALNRWVCEIENIYFKNTWKGFPDRRFDLTEGPPKCKCYPQMKKSMAKPWERIKGQPSNAEGFIEKAC